ncbi:unnamed protein product [Brachionus calyciflorus]|uniref:Uncharacterized protein n=1 Tax=Brachionus calyciflorus TaxID=104777 RepID=A0A813MY14_9BILA|nr:unnamed protein product [Brachionus calyciflorus]
MKTTSLPKRRVGRPTKEESQKWKDLIFMRNINRPSQHPSSSPDVIMLDEPRSSNTDTFYPKLIKVVDEIEEEAVVSAWIVMIRI